MSIKEWFHKEFKLLRQKIREGFKQSDEFSEIISKSFNSVFDIISSLDLNEDTNRQLFEIKNEIEKILRIWRENIHEQKSNCVVLEQLVWSTVDFLYHAAVIDELTNLQNSRAFRIHWINLLEKGEEFKIVFFDLDKFKEINDQYWHNKWDVILQKFAELLLDFFSWKNNFVYRLWGDEFIIISYDAIEEIESNIVLLQKKIDNWWILFIDNLWELVKWFKLWITSWVSFSDEECTSSRSLKNWNKLDHDYWWLKENISYVDKLRWLIELADSRMYNWKKEKKD